MLLIFAEIIVNINVNTKDYSYQLAAPKTPVAPRPLLVAVWETRCLETVDIMMELGADTSVLFSSEPNREKPKPLFFHVGHLPFDTLLHDRQEQHFEN